MVFALTLGMTTAASAQSPYQIGVSGGASEFDLSGTGVTPAWGMHVDRSLTPNWLVGAHVGFARPAQQFGFGTRSTLVVPEAQVQHQWRFGRLVPFAGAGVGTAIDFRPETFGGNDAEFTASGFGGAQFFMGENFGVRGEFRGRGIGSRFTGSAAESRAGVFWRF